MYKLYDALTAFVIYIICKAWNESCMEISNEDNYENVSYCISQNKVINSFLA